MVLYWYTVEPGGQDCNHIEKISKREEFCYLLAVLTKKYFII